MATNHKRDSSFECLRIFCITGIAAMHALGPICGDPRFIVLANSENSLFNIGVTCFILISGYFGVKWSFSKFIRYNLLAVFAGLLNLVFKFSATHSFARTDLLRTMFPVFTARWWFLSCYVCLMMLAPFLEKLLDRLSRRDFQILLAVLILWFYVCPTFLYFQLMNDVGKGLVNFLTVYLIGRYIQKYHKPSSDTPAKIIMAGGGYSNNILCADIYGKYSVYKSF